MKKQLFLATIFLTALTLANTTTTTAYTTVRDRNGRIVETKQHSGPTTTIRDRTGQTTRTETHSGTHKTIRDRNGMTIGTETRGR